MDLAKQSRLQLRENRHLVPSVTNASCLPSQKCLKTKERFMGDVVKMLKVKLLQILSAGQCKSIYCCPR